MKTKFKSTLILSLTSVIALSGVLIFNGINNFDHPSFAKAECEAGEHVGNHYAANASTATLSGNVEFWACCECHKQYTTNPGGTFTDAAALPAGTLEEGHIAYVAPNEYLPLDMTNKHFVLEEQRSTIVPFDGTTTRMYPAQGYAGIKGQIYVNGDHPTGYTEGGYALWSEGPADNNCEFTFRVESDDDYDAYMIFEVAINTGDYTSGYTFTVNGEQKCTFKLFDKVYYYGGTVNNWVTFKMPVSLVEGMNTIVLQSPQHYHIWLKGFGYELIDPYETLPNVFNNYEESYRNSAIISYNAAATGWLVVNQYVGVENGSIWVSNFDLGGGAWSLGSEYGNGRQVKLVFSVDCSPAGAGNHNLWLYSYDFGNNLNGRDGFKISCNGGEALEFSMHDVHEAAKLGDWGAAIIPISLVEGINRIELLCPYNYALWISHVAIDY